MKDSNPRNWLWRPASWPLNESPANNLAEPTGVEPVPADRQSAILPIDHSSGSLRGLEPRFLRSERSVLPLDEEGSSKLSKISHDQKDPSLRGGNRQIRSGFCLREVTVPFTTPQNFSFIASRRMAAGERLE